MSDVNDPVRPATEDPWPLAASSNSTSSQPDDRRFVEPSNQALGLGNDSRPTEPDFLGSFQSAQPLHSAARGGHAGGHHLDEVAHHAEEVVEQVNKRMGRDIFAATGVGLALIVAIGASLSWFPWGFVGIIGVGLVIAEVEVARAIKAAKGWNVVFAPLVVGSLALVVGVYAFYGGSVSLRAWAPMAWVFGCLAVTTIVVLIWRLTGPVEGYVADVGATLMLLTYLPLLASSLCFILASPEGGDKIFAYIIIITAADSGALFVGLFLGKHKMAPRLSPKKTWEGIVGAFVVGGAASIILFGLWLDEPWWKALIISVSFLIVGTLGDLVESIIKRDLGVKDMGHILPGHGGVMDRVDAFVLCAFPAWALMTWLF